MPEFLAGDVQDFEPGKFRTFLVKDAIEIGLTRLRSGEFCAIRNTCPHRLAPVCKGEIRGAMLPSSPLEPLYGMEDRVLKCPWHGYQFDLSTGESIFIGSKLRLKTYPVSVRDNEVYVTI